jgi:hypothetical protein
MAPEDGAVLAAPPARIIVGFTRELDATRADTTTVRLERIAGEAGDESATAVALEPSVPAGNPRALLLTPRSTLMAGRYQLVLSGQAGAQISALDGATLSAPPADANGDRIIARFIVAETP